MIHLTEKTCIRVAIKPVDFRRQIDGLVAQCKSEYKKDPRDGLLYAFINKSKSMIRLLHYDGTGYWIATKRLSKGRYHGWPNGSSALSSLEASQLRRILVKK